MKIIFSIFFSLFSLSIYAQPLWLKENAFPVSSISPQEENFSDLQPLKERIGNARVVMLGEQTHGDGATFDAKARVVKFLHKEMGFDLLAFEGEMYALMKADEAIAKGEDHYEVFRQSLFSIWSYAEEFRPVMDYVARNRNTASPLQITGFDVQNGSDFMVESFISELSDFLSNELNAEYDEEFFMPVEQLISEFYRGDFKNYTPGDSLLFYKSFNQIQAKLTKAKAKPGLKKQALIWERLLNNLSLELQYRLNERNGVKEIVQNSRDKAMAENLLFLLKLYPEKKIICWGASYHFAKSWNTIEAENDTTIAFLEKIKIDQSTPEYDTDEMKQAVAMGEIISDSLGDNLYSLAFTSYEGSYAYDTIRPVYPAPEGSIEKWLFDKNVEYAFVDYSKAHIPDNEKFFFSMPEGYVPFKADWQKMFDGIFYIREMYPSTSLRVNATVQATNDTAVNPVMVFSGRVINKSTDEPVSYVNIGVKNKAIGTASNEDGRFALKIPQSTKNDVVQISAIGYEGLTIPLSDIKPHQPQTIKLQPGSYTLAEVTVKAKGLSPKQIVRRAIKNVDVNYAQFPYSMELYYRKRHFSADTVHCASEAALEFYDSEGFRKSSWRSLVKERFLKLTQFRTSAPDKKTVLRPSEIWVFWAHDYTLTRDNPFSRHGTLGYVYKLEEIIPSKDSDIYKISFNCTKKSNYFTGWGSPDSLSGYLYINQKDYALVRYEYYLETSWDMRNGDSIRRKENVIHSYRNYNGVYFLDLIKEKTNHGFMKAKSGTWSNVLYDEVILVTNIETASPRVIKEKMMEFNTDIPYNKEFWESFNIVLD